MRIQVIVGSVPPPGLNPFIERERENLRTGLGRMTHISIYPQKTTRTGWSNLTTLPSPLQSSSAYQVKRGEVVKQKQGFKQDGIFKFYWSVKIQTLQVKHWSRIRNMIHIIIQQLNNYNWYNYDSMNVCSVYNVMYTMQICYLYYINIGFAINLGMNLLR